MGQRKRGRIAGLRERAKQDIVEEAQDSLSTERRCRLSCYLIIGGGPLYHHQLYNR